MTFPTLLLSMVFKRSFVLLVLILSLFTFAQSKVQEPQTIAPDKPVERQIASGETHSYQIKLTSGQFIHATLNQVGIDLKLSLVAPDGKQIEEADFTRAGDPEALSAEAEVSGDYRVVVRAGDQGSLRGSYALRLEVRATATARDKERITAERLMVEGYSLLSRSGMAQQALEKSAQALEIWRRINDRFWEAFTLFEMGNANRLLSRWDKAIENFEQALTITRELKDPGLQARLLLGSEIVFTNTGRSEQALNCYEEALTFAREANDKISQGTSLAGLGARYFSLGRYEKSIEYTEQSLVIYRETGNRDREGIALANLSREYQAVGGNSEKALDYAEKAVAIFREVKNRDLESFALTALGRAYVVSGGVEKSIEYFEQALAIERELKNRAAEGGTLYELGSANRSLGRYEQAIENLEQAHAIYLEVKNRRDQGYALNQLGLAYLELNRYEKAIEYFEQALGIFREVKDRAGEGVVHLNLGLSYRRLGDNAKAIEYYEQALAIHREVKNRIDEGMTLNDLATPYRLTGRPQKAIEYGEQALAIARDIKSRYLQANVLGDLGLGYHSLGHYDKAIECFEQAVAIQQDIKDQRDEVTTLKDLARSEAAQGNLLASRNHIEESLKLAESLRTGVVSPESRASFLSSVQDAYQLYTDLLMRQHQAEPTKGYDALAVEVSERQRARSLLDLLSEAKTDVHQGVDAALLGREHNVRQELNAKAQRLMQTNKSDEVATLKQEISQLETDLERAQAEIRKASPHYAALTQPQPLKLKEIQQQLEQDTLLLEYALGEEHSYLWAINKDSLVSYELPKEEVIKQSALELNQLLTARATGERAESPALRLQRISLADEKLPGSATALSKILLGPVASQLGNKRLVIVADGILQYIPFAMLPEPSVVNSQLAVTQKKRGTGEALQPLIVNHEVVSLPSASALAIQRSELAGRKPAPKLLAVIADPVFDRSDERFKLPAAGSKDEAQLQTVGFTETRILEHLADDKSGVAIHRLVIPRLPFTRQEANQLLALAPKTSSFSAIDFQANRATVLSGELSQYRYVHFATHGWLDSERPGLSALVLSMVDAQGKPEDGFLRANDIYNLTLPAELVVLSACQTGLGKEIKGEGLVGLTRGFMYAGAATIVVSLWSVNDRATADLMTKFYEKMLKQQERPAAALRAAQVEMWKQTQWHSPYYWAAFTMQGEWR